MRNPLGPFRVLVSEEGERRETVVDTRVRRAQTEVLFRDVNERIAESAERFGSEHAEFVCECSDADCASRVETRLEEYDEVRSDATHFLIVAGHEDPDIERVVERRGGRAVIEKFEAVVRQIVQRSNPRPA